MTQEIQALEVRQEQAMDRALTVEQLHDQLQFVRQVMAREMKEGQDYGKIPGCGDKPGLFQPGAQKLMLTFKLTPHVKREVMRELPHPSVVGHREYEFTISARSQTGREWDGVGTCSTLESKYRWRSGSRKCPNCGKEAIIKGKSEYGGGWLCYSKKGGCGTKWPDGAKEIEGQSTERIEYDNPADYWNTCRKMAFKRAQVHASINATNTSELWSQDLEDLPKNGDDETESQQTPSGDGTSKDGNLKEVKAVRPSHAGSTPAAGPGPANEVGKPGDDPNWFWGVICPIPRKGMKRDEYLRKPDTILDLYNFTKQGDDSAKKRLYGFANQWKPEPRVWQGKTYQPSDAELTFRKALDAFLEWEKQKKAQAEVHEQANLPVEGDSVPF